MNTQNQNRRKNSPAKVLVLVFGIVGALLLVLGIVIPLVVVNVPELGSDMSPEEVKLFVLVFGGVYVLLGIIFLLVAGLTERGRRRRAALREELERFGTRVTGQVVEVRVDRSVRINGRSPEVAMVRFTTPRGTEMTVKSPRMWKNTLQEGDPCEVLVDTMDDTQYVLLIEE